MSLPPIRAVRFAPLAHSLLPLRYYAPTRCAAINAPVLAESVVVAEIVLQTTASRTCSTHTTSFVTAVWCSSIRPASACSSSRRQAGHPRFMTCLLLQLRPTSLPPAPWHNSSRGLVSVELMAPPHLFSGSLCVHSLTRGHGSTVGPLGRGTIIHMCCIKSVSELACRIHRWCRGLAVACGLHVRLRL